MTATRIILYGFAALIGLSGCSGMSRQDQNTFAGAGLGGVAGGVLTDGSPAGVLGGAAAGGILGHVLTPDDTNYRNRNNQYYGNGRNGNGYNNGSGSYNRNGYYNRNQNNGNAYNNNRRYYNETSGWGG